MGFGIIEYLQNVKKNRHYNEGICDKIQMILSLDFYKLTEPTSVTLGLCYLFLRNLSWDLQTNTDFVIALWIKVEFNQRFYQMRLAFYQYLIFIGREG